MLERYRAAGRSFPWRDTRDPWAILVSEVMLQQTGTSRVLGKYGPFLEAFPDARALATAPLASLLALWSGLGYNRRALALKRAAEAIALLPGARPPADEAGLLALPGVGSYTARAVLAFAHGAPVILVETNIRSVFLHHFFPGREGVRDRELEPFVALSLDRADPRSWYYALMDYGVELKAALANPGRRSASYARQSPFADSRRRVRGAILRELQAAGGSRALDELAAVLPFSRERVEEALAGLVAEGFAEYSGDGARIAD